MFKALKQVSTEFCLNSSIHGIRYVAESGRSFAEKLLWGCVILTNLTAAVIVVYMNSYDLSQLFIREHIKSLHYPTYVAPHPAYTFCPSNFQTSRANKFINRLSLPFNVSRADILEDLNLLQLLINTRSISNEDISSGKLHRLQTVLDYNFFSIELAIKQLIMPCSELFVKCVVGGILVNCSEMVIAIKTDIGFCCSVQSSSPYTINDLIYRKKLTKIIGTYGLEFGHSFILNLSINDQFYTKNPASGIQLFVHNRLQYPQIYSIGTFVSNGWESFMRLHVILTKSSAALRSVSYSLRRCYFEDEIKLKYFQVYCFSNCVSEARMDFIVSKCGCLPVMFPSQGMYRTCNLNDLKCLITYQFSDVYGYSEDVYVKLDGVKYPCYHKCTYATYYVYSAATDFSASHVNAFKLYDTLNTSSLSVVHLYRDSSTVWLNYREPAAYNWDTISSYGGVMGIFLGINFFSVFEFVYFYTIRLFHSISNH